MQGCCCVICSFRRASLSLLVILISNALSHLKLNFFHQIRYGLHVLVILQSLIGEYALEMANKAWQKRKSMPSVMSAAVDISVLLLSLWRQFLFVFEKTPSLRARISLSESIKNHLCLSAIYVVYAIISSSLHYKMSRELHIGIMGPCLNARWVWRWIQHAGHGAATSRKQRINLASGVSMHSLGIDALPFPSLPSDNSPNSSVLIDCIEQGSAVALIFVRREIKGDSALNYCTYLSPTLFCFASLAESWNSSSLSHIFFSRYFANPISFCREKQRRTKKLFCDLCCLNRLSFKLAYYYPN